jgi:cytochrome c
VRAVLAWALPLACALSLAACAASATPGTQGDARAGAAIYERCAGCHAMEADRTGPRHCGLVGRRAGSVEGFDYSPAMKRSGIVWTRAALDRFLADPIKAVPGTSMGYSGVADARERADLVAYLAQAGDPQACGKVLSR